MDDLDTLTTPGQDGAPAPNSQEVAEMDDDALVESLAEDESVKGGEVDAADVEDVEYEGKSYKVPKELKGALLRQADYTRKTQEAAELRKAAEARQAAVEAREKQAEVDLEEHAQLVALSKSIEAYEKLDWRTMFQQNQADANIRRLELDQMKDAARRIAIGLQEKQERRRLESEQTFAAKLKERDAVLAREIPNWSKETETKVKQFGIAQGLTEQEVESIVDPRFAKILNLARVGAELQAKAKAALAKRQGAETIAEPTKTVTAKRSPPPTGLDDRLPIDEWRRRREAQLRAKA